MGELKQSNPQQSRAKVAFASLFERFSFQMAGALQRGLQILFRPRLRSGRVAMCSQWELARPPARLLDSMQLELRESSGELWWALSSLTILAVPGERIWNCGPARGLFWSSARISSLQYNNGRLRHLFILR